MFDRLPLWEYTKQNWEVYGLAKRIIRVDVDFKEKWVKGCGLCMAASLFLRAVYYLGFTNFFDIGFIEVLFCALLPLVLSGAFVVLLSGLHRNIPATYGFMGAAFCFFAIVASFYTGNALRIILGVAWYAIAGGVVLLTSTAKLQNKSLSVAVFVIPIVVRVVIFDIGRLSVFGWTLELSGLFMLASLACMPMFLKIHRK